MRKYLAVVSACLSGTISCLSQINPYDTIKEIEAHITEHGHNPLNYPEIIEDFPGLESLQTFVTATELNSITALLAKSRSPQIQRVILYACESLPPREYVTVVEATVKLRKEGKASEEILTAAIFPRGRLRDLFVDNFQDSKLRQVLTVAQQTSQKGGHLAQAIDSILAGEMKANLDKYRDAISSYGAARTVPVDLNGR